MIFSLLILLPLGLSFLYVLSLSIFLFLFFYLSIFTFPFKKCLFLSRLSSYDSAASMDADQIVVSNEKSGVGMHWSLSLACISVNMQPVVLNSYRYEER